MKKKGEFWTSYLGFLIIAIAFLVIMVFGYMALKQKGFGAVEYIKHLFRFGR